MTLRTPEPFEARRLEALAVGPKTDAALVNIITAIQGGMWPSDTVNGAMYTIRFLRDNPEYREVLFSE